MFFNLVGVRFECCDLGARSQAEVRNDGRGTQFGLPSSDLFTKRFSNSKYRLIDVVMSRPNNSVIFMNGDSLVGVAYKTAACELMAFGASFLTTAFNSSKPYDFCNPAAHLSVHLYYK